MASSAGNNLISLDESDEDVGNSSIASPASQGSVNKDLPQTPGNGLQRDSFSDLANLMKAKKSYTPTPPPTTRATPVPRTSMSPTPNGLHFENRNVVDNITAPIPPKSIATSIPLEKFLREQEMKSDTLRPLPGAENSLDDTTHLELKCTSASQCPSNAESQPRPISPLNPVRHSDSALTALDQPSRFVSLAGHEDLTQAHAWVTKRRCSSALCPGSAVLNTKADSLRAIVGEDESAEDVLKHTQSQVQSLLAKDYESVAEIGKLRYQEEVHRNQKARLGRYLDQKDFEIKKQQLAMDGLKTQLSHMQLELLASQKANEEKSLQQHFLKEDKCRTEQEIHDLRAEHDAAIQAQSHNDDHAANAQDLANFIAKKEGKILELREQKVREQMKTANLEEEIERLRVQLNTGYIVKIKDKLQEKNNQCDRYRMQLKQTEQQLKVVQSRLSTALNGGQALRGAAHLVAPNPNTKLPNAIIACSECYANNLDCDSSARCRNCTERDEKCTRWRCSLKHKLGECTQAPCTWPHDSEGWLILRNARPEW